MTMTFNFWLQSRLTAHGFSPGPIDGIIGEKTIAALKAFEVRWGLVPDGTADPAVVKALRASASAVSPAEQAIIPDRDIGLVAFPPSVPNPWPTQARVRSYYGEVGQNQTTIEIPYDMWLAWDRTIRARRMTLHEKVAPSALRVLNRVAGTYSTEERKSLGLDLFAGSLNVRKMRGGKSYSMHSWGIAIDFDSARNQLSWARPQARLSHADAEPFWEMWESEGWVSLGRERDFDWMHVQAATL